MSDKVVTKKDAYPLAWPEGWIRTRIQDRKSNAQWKLPLQKCQELLMKELERMGVTSMQLSTNIPVGLRGQLITGTMVRDPGVALYFSRQPKEDYSWQDILHISNPAPTRDEVEDAAKPLLMKFHPDHGGDMESFKMVMEAKTKAIAWIEQRENQEHQHVIACDKFNEVRLNLNAIRLTIAALRTFERCGTSAILERAFKGFEALPENANVTVGTSARGA